MQDDLKKIWTKEDEEKLIQLRKEGKSFIQIGKLIDKTSDSCCGKYKRLIKNTIKEDVKKDIEETEEIEKIEKDIKKDIEDDTDDAEKIIEDIEKENDVFQIKADPKKTLKINKSILPENFSIDRSNERPNGVTNEPEDFTYILKDVTKDNKKKKIDLFNKVKKAAVNGPKCVRCGEDAKSFLQLRHLDRDHEYRHGFLCESCEKEINVLLNTPKTVRNII